MSRLSWKNVKSGCHYNDDDDNQSRTLLVKAKRLSSGGWHNKDRSITIDDEFLPKKSNCVKAATMRVEFGDCSIFETSSQTSGTRTDESSDTEPSTLPPPSTEDALALQEKNKISGGQEEELEYMFRCTPSTVSEKDRKILQNMLSKLTDEEKDIAAKTDFRYYRLARAAKKSGLPPSDALLRAHEDAAMALAHRYLLNYKKEQVAFDEVRASIEFRKEHQANEARFCFMDEPTSAQNREWAHKCKNYIGSRARCIALNYDEDGRANVYATGRFATEHTKRDLEGFVGSHGYMFERALAATQTKTNGKQDMVNIILDFHGFTKKEHGQPLFMLTEMLRAMKLCYPERVFRVYLVDPPMIARFVFNMFKPLASTFGTPKEIIMVNGAKQRAKHFGDIDITYTEKIDIDKFYYMPFDKVWTDLPECGLVHPKVD